MNLGKRLHDHSLAIAEILPCNSLQLLLNVCRAWALETSGFRNSRWISINGAVALKVGDSRVTVAYDQGNLITRIDGILTTLKARTELRGGGFIVHEASGYVIGWSDGSLARVFRNVNGVDISMKLAPGRKGTVHGMLGPFTGERSNKVEARDGTRLRADENKRLYGFFADSWRVTQAE